MTEKLFFDTDCLSAFLWINNQSLLAQLYPGRIVIPQEVYTELSFPTVPQLKSRMDAMLASGDAKKVNVQVGTNEYILYRKLVSNPDPGHVIIGNGEAAAIALAKEQGGILASNNLRDIAVYIKEYELQHMTTGDIMKEALDRKLITEAEGNQLWQNMLNKRRRLGYTSFTEYLKTI